MCKKTWTMADGPMRACTTPGEIAINPKPLHVLFGGVPAVRVGNLGTPQRAR
eukprot:COSAG02_NODE_1280_length_13477_cov_9.042906_7_plen_52_part_00